MDPVTQGLLGAAASCAGVGRRAPERVRPKLWWLGALGGMAADLDILIRAPADPMVALTFHRHFTHSISFIPFGGLLVALPFAMRAPADERKWIAAATTLGYATHALLDAFTSYGTLLWWPFSQTRVAWNTISIIDPIYTGLLLIGVWMARRRLTGGPAALALLASSSYMAFCGIVRAEVQQAQARVLEAEGIVADARFTFPLLLANTRWRGLTVEGDRLHAHGFAKPWFGEVVYLPGEPVARFDPELAPPAMFEGPGGQRVREALETLDWFAGKRLYIEEEGPGWWRVCDARYSMKAAGFAGVFCWTLEPGRDDEPVRQQSRSAGRRDGADMRAMLPFGGSEDYRALP